MLLCARRFYFVGRRRSRYLYWLSVAFYSISRHVTSLTVIGRHPNGLTLSSRLGVKCRITRRSMITIFCHTRPLPYALAPICTSLMTHYAEMRNECMPMNFGTLLPRMLYSRHMQPIFIILACNR